MNRDFWKIYSSLIEPIPATLRIKRGIQREKWTIVDSECGAGVAMTSASLPTESSHSLMGKSLKEVASWVTSWDFSKASFGMAAINSYWNQRERVEQSFASPLEDLAARESIENLLISRFRNQKVLFVGHFPFSDSMRSQCQVVVLERRKITNTLPDTACEVLIPEQDAVVVTASSLVNKSFVRLSELCSGRFSLLLGPTTPLSPVLSLSGYSQISGIVPKDSQRLYELIENGASREILGEEISWKVDIEFGHKSEHQSAL